MTFATIKKRFAEALQKAELKPTTAYVEMGEFQGKQYEVEGDYTVSIDPEGDAWIFLGPHADFARQIKQDGNPETTVPALRALHKRVRASKG